MDILFPRCAGIDIHKRTVVACRIVLTDDGEWLRETRTYGTTSEELLRLADWLALGGCTHVGLASTGEYWKPVFNVLEARVSCCLLLGTLDTSRAIKVSPRGRDSLRIQHDVPGQPGFDLHAA
jgi:hypothetical protein